MGKGTDKFPHECRDFFAELEDCDDPRDAYARLQDRIRAYASAGRPVPEALRRRRRDLMTEFMAQSQGR